jgi:omega-hydroxy-beta-dihydromenaquinone-9 sulfotransferase
MSIRDQLSMHLGPSLCPGIRTREWLTLLCDNRFRVELRYGLRAGSITLCSIVNSVLARYEDLRFGGSVRSTEVAPPLFILGHWRSGTTLLQSLFALDRRFAGPTLFEVLFPHTFLTTERLLRCPLSLLVPRTRHTDNMRFGLDVPYEDEFALCTMTLCSPHLSVVMLERSAYYDRFLSLRGVSDADLERWRANLMVFLKKLTLKQQRPLVLKSPPHTARIRPLLEIFPEAKFLHIHRDPYAVFQSMLRLVNDSSRRQRLQRPRHETLEDLVLRWYYSMYEAFFEDRGLIPKGRFHEIRFEELERDVVEVMRHSYEALDLPTFGDVEPEIRRYAAAIKGYQKTVHDPLERSLRERIARECGRCFEEWGYST